MCEPVSMIMMAMSGVAGLAGTMMASKAAKSTPAPPPAAIPKPAAAPPVNRNPGATIRLGTGKQDEADAESGSPMYGGAVVKRQSGSGLGNLGKSSLI